MNNNENSNNNNDKSINNNDNDNNKIASLILVNNVFYIMLQRIYTNVSFH